MKRSSTILVFFIGVIALILLFLGISWLNSGLKINARFDKIEGIREGTLVVYNGLEVGKVSDVQVENVNGVETGKIIVSMSLRQDLQVPKYAMVRISQALFFDNIKLELMYDKGCSGEDCLKNGDLIQGIAPLSSWAEVLNTVKDNVAPIVTPVVGMIWFHYMLRNGLHESDTSPDTSHH